MAEEGSVEDREGEHEVAVEPGGGLEVEDAVAGWFMISVSLLESSDWK